MKYVYHLHKQKLETTGNGILYRSGTSTIYVLSNYDGEISGVTIETATGTTGDVYYHINEDKTTLLIYGNGNMKSSYLSSPSPQWSNYKETITLVRIEYGVESVGSHSFFKDNYYQFKQLKYVLISKTVKKLGEWSFARSLSLEKIDIPASVILIGGSSFDNCQKLKYFNVHPNNQYYCNDTYGVLFDKNKTILIHYALANGETKYEVPHGVQTISEDAFWPCSLEEIKLPNTLLTIKAWAFDGCTSLKKLKFQRVYFQ